MQRCILKLGVFSSEGEYLSGAGLGTKLLPGFDWEAICRSFVLIFIGGIHHQYFLLSSSSSSTAPRPPPSTFLFLHQSSSSSAKADSVQACKC